jgi:hypothetical protein
MRVRVIFCRWPPYLTIPRHSFGGVEHKAFPDIVPELKDPNNTLSVAHFDSTFSVFDNKVCVLYRTYDFHTLTTL